MIRNGERAQWAAQSMQVFADLTTKGEIDEDSVGDLICDLGHFAELEMKLERSEILRIFAIGIGAWLAESDHPEGDPDANMKVAIVVGR